MDDITQQEVSARISARKPVLGQRWAIGTNSRVAAPV